MAVTPLAPSRTLSALTNRDLLLKFENLQFTASFKERGALNRLSLLSESERQRGVVAMSAGNHAQALAYHGGRLGVPVTIVMPKNTPNAKVRQTSVFGAEVVLRGDTFAATLAVTEELALRRGATLIHPFDDEAVIAGQGTLGLELLEQAPNIDTIVVPVGGGGLIAGIAVAARALRPDIRIVGVQTERFAAVHDALQGEQATATRPGTVAEGIAVETPGKLTLPIIREHVERVVTVTEAQIEDAVFTLLEVEKTVTEGAGACPLAALRAYPDIGAGGTTALVLTGGNIDMMILSSILQRGLVRTHRLVRIKVEAPDVPGAMADLTRILGDLDSNIVDITHQRAFAASTVRTTAIEFVLQMRGEEQVEAVLGSLHSAGYVAEESG